MGWLRPLEGRVPRASRPSRDWRAWLAGVALAAAALSVQARPAEVDAPGGRPLAIEILSGGESGRDGRSVTVEDGGARLQLRFDLPPAADGDGWLLRLERVGVDRVELAADGWRSGPRSVFAPEPGEGLLPGAFEFMLPASWTGPQALELVASGRGPYTLRPSVLPAKEALALEHRAIALAGAMYASLVVLALIALSLLGATRDRAYLVLFGFLLASLGFLLANSGHLYAWPWVRGFALLGPAGIWAATLLTAASGVWLAQHYACLRMHAPRLRTRLSWLALALTAAAALCLLNLPDRHLLLKAITVGGWIIGALGVLAAISVAVRRRIWMSLPVLLSVVGLVVAGVFWELRVFGYVEDGFWVRVGFQLTLVACALLVTIGLVGRITEFRTARDRDRLARDDSERRLEREAARADLVHTLQKKLRDLPPGDMEWAAFRAAFERLLPLLRLEAGALIAYGYHGFDLLLAEPLRSKEHFVALLANRVGMMKGLARTQAPLQLPLEQDDNGNGVKPEAFPATVVVDGAEAPAGATPRRLHAVIPLPIRAPGWGVLLLERSGAEPFTHEELAFASELGRLAVRHADEAATALNLRRSAELDALTGALNRRTIDLWLTRSFTEAHRHGHALAVLFVDLDLFKRINDTHGHACGDACLRQVSEALRRELEPGDLLGRYGGEEFIVVLPGRNGDSARQVAERIRAAVEREQVTCDGRKVPMTVSVGVATRLDREDSPGAAVERADKALYAAKRAGRNRVNVAPAIFV
jgi:diguanylate cyclase (GGDEF)-like protein